MTARPAIEAAIFDGMVADLRARIEAQGAAVGGLLSLPPACPRAPSLGVPDLGRVGRGKREKAGPGGPSMNSKGAEISHFGETWGGSRERKTRGAGAAADCLSVRNQWFVYPKFIFGESGESREGG